MKEYSPSKPTSEDQLFWAKQDRYDQAAVTNYLADCEHYLKERDQLISNLFALCHNRYNAYAHLSYTEASSDINGIDFQGPPLAIYSYNEWQLSQEVAEPVTVYRLELRALNDFENSGVHAVVRLNDRAAEITIINYRYVKSTPYVENMSEATAMLPEQLRSWLYYFHDAEAAAPPIPVQP